MGRIPPPLFYGAAFAAGVLLDRFAVALPIGGRPVTGVAGGALLAAGGALAGAGVAEVVRHRTTVIPHHPVAQLVTTGIYRLTRNPMYTGMAVASIGGALLVGSYWPLLTLPAAVLTVRRIVIEPEERYLAERFGQRYAEYRSRVRRWL